jgi:hypothetical protein
MWRSWLSAAFFAAAVLLAATTGAASPDHHHQALHAARRPQAAPVPTACAQRLLRAHPSLPSAALGRMYPPPAAAGLPGWRMLQPAAAAAGRWEHCCWAATERPGAATPCAMVRCKRPPRHPAPAGISPTTTAAEDGRAALRHGIDAGRHAGSLRQGAGAGQGRHRQGTASTDPLSQAAGLTGGRAGSCPRRCRREVRGGFRR